MNVANPINTSWFSFPFPLTPRNVCVFGPQPFPSKVTLEPSGLILTPRPPQPRGQRSGGKGVKGCQWRACCCCRCCHSCLASQPQLRPSTLALFAFTMATFYIFSPWQQMWTSILSVLQILKVHLAEAEINTFHTSLTYILSSLQLLFNKGSSIALSSITWCREYFMNVFT